MGRQCSNPNCRQPTSGPQQDPAKSVNVGVAAHITAASRSGARYDSLLSKEERCSIENAIWLCQTCAKLVDNDPLVYTRELLREWKRLSEEAARLAIEERQTPDTKTRINDMDLIRFCAQCLDRPAFGSGSSRPACSIARSASHLKEHRKYLNMTTNGRWKSGLATYNRGQQSGPLILSTSQPARRAPITLRRGYTLTTSVNLKKQRFSWIFQ